MRSLTLLALAAVTTGCASLDPQLERAGTLIMPASGLAIFADGHRAHAAMLGSTCEITTGGNIGDDRSVTGRGAPELLDGESTDEGDTVLVRTRDRVHLMQAPARNGGVGAMSETVRAELTVAQAGLSDHGAVALTPDCAVHWLDRDLASIESVALTGGADTACDASSLAIARDSGDAWVALGGDLLHTDGGAPVLVDTGADAVTWSAQADSLLVTDSTRGELRALDASGALRWSTSIDGPLLQVADFPNAGVALVVSAFDDLEDERGILRFIDLRTGAVDREVILPRAARVQPGLDGQTFALLRPNMTQFFRVR